MNAAGIRCLPAWVIEQIRNQCDSHVLFAFQCLPHPWNSYIKTCSYGPLLVLILNYFFCLVCIHRRWLFLWACSCTYVGFFQMCFKCKQMKKMTYDEAILKRASVRGLDVSLAPLCWCAACESETSWQHIKSCSVFPWLKFRFRNTHESFVITMSLEDRDDLTSLIECRHVDVHDPVCGNLRVKSIHALVSLPLPHFITSKFVVVLQPGFQAARLYCK